MTGGWGELGAFALIMALGQFSPGPDMLLLTRSALAEGLKVGLLIVLGIVTGLLLHATLALVGMAAILAAGGWLALVMRMLASGYLIYLALSLMRSKGAFEEVEISSHPPYVRGLLCNLLNPKVAIFFAGAVTPFLSIHHPLTLGVVIVLEGLILWSLWVILLQHQGIRACYRKASGWIDRAFGVGLLALGVLIWFSL